MGNICDNCGINIDDVEIKIGWTDWAIKICENCYGGMDHGEPIIYPVGENA